MGTESDHVYLIQMLYTLFVDNFLSLFLKGTNKPIFTDTSVPSINKMYRETAYVVRATGANYFVFCRLLPSATTAVFGSHLSSLYS